MNPEVSLAEAKAWLRGHVDEGAPCPCCTQFAKVYRRQITGASAAALIRMWRVAGFAPAHLPTVLRRYQADEAKMVHWGLIADEGERRDDGGRAGWWSVTEHGRAWILGEVTVPRYAYIYNARCLRLDGEPRTIRQALGTKFNYRELMDS